MIVSPLPDRSVWRNGPFVRLWVAQAVTQTALNAMWYALLVIVEELSHSTTQLAITILTLIVPSILFGVPAGVYVDRWDKRTVLVATSLARCVIALSYIFLGGVLALLYAVSLVFSLVTQFFAPAELAMIPAVVGRRKLMEATSLFHLTFTASQLVGLVLLGPIVVKLLGTQSFFILVGSVYGLCALLLAALPSQPASRAKSAKRRPLAEMLAQVQEVRQLLLADRVMLWSMGYWTAGATLSLLIAMVAPRFVVDVLGIAASDTVFVLGPAFVGTLGAAVLLSRTPPADWTERLRLIQRGLFVVAACLGIIGGVPAIVRALGLLRPEAHPVDVLTQWDALVVGSVMLTTLVGGFGFTAIMIAAQTALQERAPAATRGRVFAVQLMFGNLASIVPLVFIGGLADVVGVNRVLLLLAIAVVAIRVLGQCFAAREPTG